MDASHCPLDLMVNRRCYIAGLVCLTSTLVAWMPVAEAQPSADSGTEEGPSQVEASADGPSQKVREEGADQASSETSGSEDWRIQLDDDPPYQVRRAVRQVNETATIVASRIAGVDPPERVAMPDAITDSSETDAPSTDDGGNTGRTPEFRRLSRSNSSSEPDRSDGATGSASAPAPSGHVASAADVLDTSGGLFEAVRGWTQPAADQTLELEPYVDDPRWREAMQLLVDDDCEEALDKVDSVLEARQGDDDGERPPAVDYVVARVKMCTDQEAEGRQTMHALADGDGTVARLAHRRLGGNLRPIEPTDDDDGVGTSFAGRLREAKRAAARGHLGKAIETLADLRDSLERAWQRYRLRLAEAEMFLDSGQIAGAARRFLGVYELTRDWEIGDRIAERIEKIEKRHDIQILPFEARVDRMRELISRGRYDKARRVSIENAKIAGVSGDEIDGWSAYRKALQAERQRDRERADELFERAERLVESPVIRSRIYYGWARALRRLDRDDEAIELYDRLCREYPRHRLCDDARYQAGRLYQYSNEHQKARSKFADVVGLHPDSQHVPDSLWRGAFSAYVMGDYEAVERPLRRLRDQYGDQEDSSGLPLSLKARYWLGAAAFKRGDLDLARERLQETINRGALTWYGRLAAARMKRMGVEPVVPRPPARLTNQTLESLETLAIPDDERLEVVAEYARLGLYENAIEELDRQMDVRPLPDKAHRLKASLQLVAGEVHEAHWMMAARIGHQSTPTVYDLRDWGIAYPVDYLDLAHKYGNRYGVSPFAVQGLMRQESGFRPAVRSWVGAVGLMQLMPGTGNEVSDDFLDGEYIDRQEMSQPETNVELGTMYLRALTGYTKGRLPMAFAGYNAGPAPLDSWFRRFGDREIDAWVESITYEQARGYSRKVYTNYVRYAALYGGRLPTPRLDLPDQFGEWGEAPELQQTEPQRPVSMFGGK